MTAESKLAPSEGSPHGIATGYQAWLIDLDGTLYRATWVRLAMALELSLGHWRAMAILRQFRHEHERLRQEGFDALESPYQIQLQRTAAKLSLPHADLEAMVRQWMHERPGKWLRLFRRKALLREIDQFRRSGGQTALVSDYPAEAKLKALGICGLFDVVVASGQPGGPRWLKPHPDGYLSAARQLGIEPSQCLVVGDRPDADGEAARRAGMGFRMVH